MIVIKLVIKLPEFEDFVDVVNKSLNIGEDDGASVCMQRQRKQKRDIREMYSVEMIVSHILKVYDILYTPL